MQGNLAIKVNKHTHNHALAKPEFLKKTNQPIQLILTLCILCCPHYFLAWNIPEEDEKVFNFLEVRELVDL